MKGENMKEKRIHTNDERMLVRAVSHGVDDATGGMRRAVSNARLLNAERAHDDGEGGGV